MKTYLITLPTQIHQLSCNKVEDNFLYEFYTLRLCHVGIEISYICIQITFHINYPDIDSLFTQELIIKVLAFLHM